MKTFKKLFALAVLFASQAVVLGQSEFPIGALTFGFQNGNDSLYTQIKEMNATWVQAWGQLGGIDCTNVNLKAVQNVAGLKVIVSRIWNIGVPARSQRLIFDAEFVNDNGGLRNYFQTHSVGSSQGVAWVATAPGTAGYMVRDPNPDKEYYYGRNLYVATFVMQKSGGNPTDNVVTLDVVDSTGAITFGSRLLKGSDFPASGYKAFDVPFNLNPIPVALPKFGVLTSAPATLYNGKVNVRAYWHGLVTTFLDFVTIQDSVTTPSAANADRWGAVQIFPRFGQTTGPKDAIIAGDRYDYFQRFIQNNNSKDLFVNQFLQTKQR